MSFLTELLEYYHITEKDLGCRQAPGSFKSLKTPFDLPSFQKVKQRMDQIVSHHEKCVIYGDYDVDGLASTAILAKTFSRLGHPVGFFIPSRYVEGYGLNANRIDQFKEKGYQVIITVDNGITALEEIEKAQKLGMEVIVIDHHQPKETLPTTPYLFHHRLSGFLDYDCSAASLAFFLSWSLLSEPDDYFACLAGMAVFSDVMPLKGNNLALAKMMKQNLAAHRFANLNYLLGNGSISYDDVSFHLIPSLNAVGRIKEDSLATNQACRFLMELEDKEKISKYGDFIVSCNLLKKEMVKNASLDSQFTLSSSHSLCVEGNLPIGLNGLLANRLMKEHGIPVAVFCPMKNNPEILVGSLRVPDGYSLDSFMSHNKNRLIAGGGHEKACGITIHKKDYFLLGTMFASECAKQALFLKPDSDQKLQISLEELNEMNYHIYESFEPFGEGFPKPSFSCMIGKEQLVFSQKGNAAFASTADQKGRLCYFGNCQGLKETELDLITFEGTLKKDSFCGKETVTLVCNQFVTSHS